MDNEEEEEKELLRPGGWLRFSNNETGGDKWAVDKSAPINSVNLIFEIVVPRNDRVVPQRGGPRPGYLSG